jgi:peroxiredoxin Q/BCP
MLTVGASFPNFSLPDQDGNIVTLNDLKGAKAVIYFYPKDDTPGCTAEACDFQARQAEIKGSKIVGVSPDPSKKHRKFADKFGLTFPLLADTDKELIGALGLWQEKSFMGKKYMGVDRTTYVLDENGVIEKIFEKVKPIGHGKQVIEYLRS